MDLSAVITQMGILFLLIAIGFAAAKCGVFPEGTNRVLAQLVIVVTNPCMILNSALSGDRPLQNSEVLLLTGVAVAAFALLVAVGQGLPRLLRVAPDERGVYTFMTTFPNVGFMGFPVVRALYGEGAVFYAAIFNLVFQFLVYTYGVALLTKREGERRFPWKVLFSPVILASVVAYGCYFTGFRAPAVVTQTLGMLGNVTSPVSMLVIGIALSAVPLRAVFGNWRLYALNAARLLLLPVSVYFLLRLWIDNVLILGITVVILGMPFATLTTLLSAKYGKRTELAASGVFLSTLMSMITIPLLMLILFR